DRTLPSTAELRARRSGARWRPRTRRPGDTRFLHLHTWLGRPLLRNQGVPDLPAHAPHGRRRVRPHTRLAVYPFRRPRVRANSAGSTIGTLLGASRGPAPRRADEPEDTPFDVPRDLPGMVGPGRPI